MQITEETLRKIIREELASLQLEAMPGVEGQIGQPGSAARMKYCAHYDAATQKKCIEAETEEAAERSLYASAPEHAYDAYDRTGTYAAAYTREHRDRTSLTKNQLADIIREVLGCK